ncbi:hypothetical protein ISCGN_027020 [Ixodes scapularis]
MVLLYLFFVHSIDCAMLLHSFSDLGFDIPKEVTGVGRFGCGKTVLLEPMLIFCKKTKMLIVQLAFSIWSFFRSFSAHEDVLWNGENERNENDRREKAPRRPLRNCERPHPLKPRASQEPLSSQTWRHTKRPSYGLHMVGLSWDRKGLGFITSSQVPCILSCLGVVNGRNVSRATHNGVVCLVGSSVQLLQITENYCLDSEDEAVPKQGHHTRCGDLALAGQWRWSPYVVCQTGVTCSRASTCHVHNRCCDTAKITASDGVTLL